MLPRTEEGGQSGPEAWDEFFDPARFLLPMILKNVFCKVIKTPGSNVQAKGEISMQRRQLGRTGLQVTVLGYGAMELRGPRIWGGRPVEPEQAEAMLNGVLDAGITFIDTSYDYGQSEELIGKCISNRRSEYYLATKCGCLLTDSGAVDEVTHVWTAEQLQHNLDTSLKRLKCDYIDLWQLHNPPPDAVQKGHLLEVMEQAQKAGKIRWIGVSSTLPHIATYIQWGAFDTFQIPYSALERTHEEVISQAAAGGAGIIIRGGVARGDPNQQGLGRKERWDVWEEAGMDDLLPAGQDRTTFLLRYTISHPAMATTIVGTMDPAHLKHNLKAVETGPLPQDVYEEAKRRLSEAGEGPA